MTKDEFVRFMADLVEFHFPKGVAHERGQAMVLVAEVTKELIDKGFIHE